MFFGKDYIQHELNESHCSYPESGDVWVERGIIYFVVVKVISDNEIWVRTYDLSVDDCDTTYPRKSNYICEWKKVDIAWIYDQVHYSHYNGFVADVLIKPKDYKTQIELFNSYLNELLNV